jgi:hypothetical protein
MPRHQAMAVMAQSFRVLPPPMAARGQAFEHGTKAYVVPQTSGIVNGSQQGYSYRDQPTSQWEAPAAQDRAELSRSTKAQYFKSAEISSGPMEKPHHSEAPPRYSIAVDEPRATNPTSYVEEQYIPPVGPPPQRTSGSGQHQEPQYFGPDRQQGAYG